MTDRTSDTSADAGSAVVDLKTFKSQRISLYSRALQAQQAALAEGRADRDAPAQPLLSTEGLLLAARLVEDVAFSFATLIPEQQVVNLLTLAARIEAELTELDSLDIITT